MILDINCGPFNYLQGFVHTSFKKVNNKGKYITKQVMFYGWIQRYFYFEWLCIIQFIFDINGYRSQKGKLNRQ
jgi:hypothetical protein